MIRKVYWTIAILSLISLGACAPLDGDIEDGLAGEPDETESSELRYAGRTRLQNSMNGHCAYRTSTSGVRVRACNGRAEEQWDAYQLGDGTYALCTPNTYASYTYSTTFGGICVPPSWREAPFRPGNTYPATCTGQITVSTSGYSANCMVRQGKNSTYVASMVLSESTDYSRYGGGLATYEASGHWSYSSPYIHWAGSERRLTVDGTGVGLYNDNGNPASQSWSLIQ